MPAHDRRDLLEWNSRQRGMDNIPDKRIVGEVWLGLMAMVGIFQAFLRGRGRHCESNTRLCIQDGGSKGVAQGLWQVQNRAS